MHGRARCWRRSYWGSSVTNSAAWIFLLIAGALEIVWALGMKSTQAFTRLWPSVFVMTTMVISGYCLSMAVKVLPIGTSYAVWTGIGAAGTAVLGILLLGEPFHALRALCMVLIIAGTLGLRFLR